MSNDLQKIVILCVVAVLIIGGILYYILNVPNAGEMQPNEDTPAADQGMPVPGNEDDDEMIVEEKREDEKNTTDGNDVGMEYPIPDGEAQVSSGMPVPNAGGEPVDDMIITNVEDDDTQSSVDENAKVFNITGRNFEFSMDEIRVNEGDTVTINFESTDGFHDWVLDAFNAKTAHVQTGGKSSVTFVAKRKGQFEYYCSVGSHRQLGMVGTLIVE